MTDGNKRRNRKRAAKRYRVRYDRIVAVALVFIVLIVIVTSCAKSCSGDENKDNTATQGQTTSQDGTAQSSIVDNLEASGETDSILSNSAEAAPTDALFTIETHSSEDISRGDLVLINADHEYPFPSDDPELLVLYDNIDKEAYGVSDLVIKLDAAALAKLDELMKDFYAETGNNDIVIIGGYRTLEEQNDKYYSGKSTFMGGHSDYHSGRMFDMGIFPKDGSSSGYYSATGDYAWIDEKAAEYGFILRFPENKESYTGEKTRSYTYRYVGAPHAVYMDQNGLCLEEYIEAIKAHTNDDPLEVTVNGTIYQMYYVTAAVGGTTDVPVPSNKTYTVSGNNVDGFIVTVTMN